MNCAKPGGDESAQPARNFLPDLNTNQISTVTVGGTPVDLLVTPSGGPDNSYNPLGNANIGVNPWRYAYPGTNNPGSYDLWIQLDIAGKPTSSATGPNRCRSTTTRCPGFLCVPAPNPIPAGRPVAWSLSGTTAPGVRAWWCGWNSRRRAEGRRQKRIGRVYSFVMYMFPFHSAFRMAGGAIFRTYENYKVKM